MIHIIDHGSQYTGLIHKQLTEMNIPCEIHSPSSFLDTLNRKPQLKGVIISGSPKTISTEDRAWADMALPKLKYMNIPVLGICFGFQLIALHSGSELVTGEHREYGNTIVTLYPEGKNHPLFKNLPDKISVWMSHSNSIIPAQSLNILSASESIITAYQVKESSMFGVLFHPEVTHSEGGYLLLQNFVQECSIKNASSSQDWDGFLEKIKADVSDIKKVICAVSGGVDSTVLAVLLSKYSEVHAIYIDHGFQRTYDLEDLQNVFKNYPEIKLHVLNERERFAKEMHGIRDPEQKRKAIGKSFIDSFENYAKSLDIKYLAQGTIASDVVESGHNGAGTAQKIKSHHNVGGLPEKINFTLVEPLRTLFKDQVRSLGVHLGISSDFIKRHPFPGPGLAIRCIGEIVPDRIEKLRKADEILHHELRSRNLYFKTWQAGVILLPIKSTGVMGDESSYEECAAIRLVDSTDAMTADATELPWKDLKQIASLIVNRVKGINRVVYDVTSKPPATIEWE